MTDYKHWCGNCQIKVYIQRHYGRTLTWADCPYTCEYATAMRCSTECGNEAEWTNADALNLQPTCNQLATDCISRQAAIDAVHKSIFDFFDICDDDEESPITYNDEQLLEVNKTITLRIKQLPSAQLEQRYTEEELKVFKHGISLSLLSKRSSQHWQYDEDTATEIKFLERLYEKVGADMRGEQDG